MSCDLLLKWVDTVTIARPATHTLQNMSVRKQEPMIRSLLQDTEEEQKDNCYFLKDRKLKLLNLYNGQNQDADIDYDVGKNSAEEKVCTFDRTDEMFNVRIPECLDWITMECS